MKRFSAIFFGVFFAGLLGIETGKVSQAQEPFFKGKQIRIVVGLSTGGGYDRAARLLARYMGKYIPGNPDLLVQNMPGAGSVTAANYVWGVCDKFVGRN